MVFNWFRRQFSNNPQEAPSEPQTPETPDTEQQDAESPPSEAAPSEPPAVSQDLLNYAKAAYRNIQQRQQETATEPDVTEPDVTEPEVVAESVAETIVIEPEVTAELEPEIPSEPEVVAEPVAETVAPVELEVTEPEAAESVTEPLTVTEETPEAVAELPTPANPLESNQEAPGTTTPPEPSNVPIWARDDRQARLERLKATAIETEETPAPQPVAAETSTPEATEDDISLDEGFMWSAEVLAAQGRKAEDISIEEVNWLKQLRQGLTKTRLGLINQLKAIVGQGPLNQDAVTEIEALLLQADVGVEATDYIINTLQTKLRDEVLPPNEAIAYLKGILRDLLDSPCQENYSATFAPVKDTLNIWLLTGVNGVGKTTTIGKLAHLSQKSGYHTLIAAADTFRAAAVQQVQVWGDRSGVEVIANPGKNTDPAAVVFDAIAAAQSRNCELLLVDTAGRLQNKKNLMDELSKIRRIVDKKAPGANVESLLVLDATLGQNGLRQAEVFSQAAKLSGVVLTKLDGSAKGGVALAVVQQLGLPIRFIGAGEGIEDLRPFSSFEFVEALLNG